MDMTKASIGFFYDYWEYKRMFYRRLLLVDDFKEGEVFMIGRKLERITNIHCYEKVKEKKQNFYVYVDRQGTVFLPYNKQNKKVRTSNIDDLVKLD